MVQLAIYWISLDTLLRKASADVQGMIDGVKKPKSLTSRSRIC